MAKKYIDDIARILCDQLDIVDVVSQRVVLKKAGKNYKGLCPFHSERTPSFVVSDERQSYKCFGCGEGGNSIGFVMATENLDFLTALETLADRYHIDLTPYKNQDFQVTSRQDLTKFYDLNRKAALLYYNNLKENKKARNYLLNRGLSEKTLIHYGLGYASENWQDLYNQIGRGLDSQSLEESGLFGQGSRGPYDRFRDRIIFPIIDLRKRVIGFGARTMDPKGIPKYLNTADTPVFSKTYHLYGLNHAKDHRGEKRRIILVEGYMDVISLYDKGVGNAVASLGTAFTSEQARLLERYCSELVILYDGDDAGIEATKRALEILDDFSMQVRVVTLPDKMDPDDYISEFGKDKFLEYIQDNSYDSIEYRLRDLEKNHKLDTIQGKRAYLEDVDEILGRIDKYSQKELYLTYIGDRLGIDVQSLRMDMAAVKKKPGPIRRRASYEEAPGILMALVIQDNQIAKRVYNHKWFFLLDDSWRELIEFLNKEQGLNIDAALDIFSIDQLDYMDKSSKRELHESDFEYWEDFLRFLLAAQLDKRVGRLKSDPQEEALEEIMLLQKMRIEIMNKEGRERR